MSACTIKRGGRLRVEGVTALLPVPVAVGTAAEGKAGATAGAAADPGPLEKKEDVGMFCCKDWLPPPDFRPLFSPEALRQLRARCGPRSST